MDKTLFSERLKEKRVAAGYKRQEDLAAALDYQHMAVSGSSFSSIKKYENCKSPTVPLLDRADDICRLLGCDLDYLTGKIDHSSHDLDFICKYTGLSEKATETLHTMASLNSECIAALNTLLENISFYREVLDCIGAGIKIPQYLPQSDEQTEDAIKVLRENGYHLSTPAETFRGYAQEAGASLTNILLRMNSNAPGTPIKAKGLTNASLFDDMINDAYLKELKEANNG